MARNRGYSICVQEPWVCRERCIVDDCVAGQLGRVYVAGIQTIADDPGDCASIYVPVQLYCELHHASTVSTVDRNGVIPARITNGTKRAQGKRVGTGVSMVASLNRAGRSGVIREAGNKWAGYADACCFPRQRGDVQIRSVETTRQEITGDIGSCRKGFESGQTGCPSRCDAYHECGSKRRQTDVHDFPP